MRQQNGWSQEETAAKLNMSTNGYGSIERGDTDVNLSRLKDIASIFGVNVSELFNKINDVETQITQLGNQPSCHFSEKTSKCNYLEMKFELEKQIVINQLLKEINELIKYELLITNAIKMR
jgi:transcriptional regulator with XRE-family HTH domain